MPSQEKKKTRGAKKVRKAGKKQRRGKISKSGEPKAWLSQIGSADLCKRWKAQEIVVTERDSESVKTRAHSRRVDPMILERRCCR